MMVGSQASVPEKIPSCRNQRGVAAGRSTRVGSKASTCLPRVWHARNAAVRQNLRNDSTIRVAIAQGRAPPVAVQLHVRLDTATGEVRSNLGDLGSGSTPPVPGDHRLPPTAVKGRDNNNRNQADSGGGNSRRQPQDPSDREADNGARYAGAHQRQPAHHVQLGGAQEASPPSRLASAVERLVTIHALNLGGE